jgi:hypothetical protein
MTNYSKKTHYLKPDFRAESLMLIILGLDNSINSLKNRMKELNWYDGLCFKEDSEAIYGLAYVAFQNYINASIKDFSNSTSDKNKYYKLQPKFKNYDKSGIELIIGLANYSKHKEDDGKLHQGTIEILKSFNLSFEKYIDINNSPVFNGLAILNDDWNLFEVLNIVKNWRELLWESQTK